MLNRILNHKLNYPKLLSDIEKGPILDSLLVLFLSLTDKGHNRRKSLQVLLHFAQRYFEPSVSIEICKEAVFEHLAY